MKDEPPEISSEEAGAEPNLLRWRAYCICRFVDGHFYNSELIDLQVAESAFAQMPAVQRATSVLMPVNVSMPKETAIEFVAEEFKQRIAYINRQRESN